MKRALREALGLAVTIVLLSSVAAADPPIPLAGLRAAAQITRDANGIAHIRAANDHDLYFLQGWVHAQDRLFQMDESRRLASGTYAELVGEAALLADRQLRTIGLRRAAVRSLAAISAETRSALEAYAEGVNAFVSANPLPLEYALLGLTQFEPWTALDSVAVGKLVTFSLAFELDIDRTIALESYDAAFPGGTGIVLFFEDVFRSAPFDPASTIPDASIAPASAVSVSGARSGAAVSAAAVPPAAVELGKAYLAAVKDNPIFQRLRTRERRGGSNEWAVSGAHTASGFAILANDPHLDLTTPSTFYPIHLTTRNRNVIGSGFAGIPFVVLGHNDHIAWGATQNPLDVTDTFLEIVVQDPASGQLSTFYQGNLEPIVVIPEVFRVNPLTGGEFTEEHGETYIVPRRNNGPLVQLDLVTGFGLSVQYTGFSPTREIDTFRMWNEARDLADFRRGLAFLDVGSQNFGYADVRGNVAYFVGGEAPLREDLQAGTPSGLPPFFIRNGTGGNEWIPLGSPRPDQAVPYEILPAEEMPQIVNPPAGFFVSANNDPNGATLDNDPLNQLRPGGGILYLGHFYDGYRAGRVTQIIRAKLANGGKLSFADMPRIQADTVLIDAQFFVPQILAANTRALASSNQTLKSLALDAGVAAAVTRLQAWDFTTPTGIFEGYDASDENGVRSPSSPSPQEAAASVAATIYAVWRSRLIANSIDAVIGPLPRPDGERTLGALRRLLEIYDATGGLGASGIPFFGTPPDGRDLVILGSLREALDALAGPAFFNAFGGSTNQDSYRWGRLHRVVFSHSFGDFFSVPPAGGAFPHPLGAALPGIPTDGGFSTVDAGTHDVRGATDNGFMFPAGPVQRFVAELAPSGVRAVSSLPGGVSGNVDSLALNLLPPYLTNDAFRLWFRTGEVASNAASVTNFVPGR